MNAPNDIDSKKGEFWTISEAVRLLLLEKDGLSMAGWREIADNKELRCDLLRFIRAYENPPICSEEVARAILTPRTGKTRVFGLREWMMYGETNFSDEHLARSHSIPFSEHELRENAKTHFLCYLLRNVNTVQQNFPVLLENLGKVGLTTVITSGALHKNAYLDADAPRTGWHLIRKRPIYAKRDREWKERVTKIEPEEEPIPLVERLQATFLYKLLRGNEFHYSSWNPISPALARFSTTEEFIHIMGTGYCLPVEGFESGKITIGLERASWSSLYPSQTEQEFLKKNDSVCIYTAFKPRVR